MNSFFANLYLGIQNRIKELVPEIRWIDQDLGQLEDYGDRPAVSWPCVLLDFESTSYSNMGELVQLADVTIGVRLAFSPYSHSASVTPLPVKVKALQYYELENKLYQALHGWDGDGNCQPLNRVATATERREDSIRVRAMQFVTQFEDDAAKPEYVAQAVDYSIEIMEPE